MWQAFIGILCVFVLGCGSRSEAPTALAGSAKRASSTEVCNGLDDDGQNGVDDPFRDARGRYVSSEHCGACNQACVPRPESELETRCGVIEDLARCSAVRCQPGYALNADGRCSRTSERLCLPCASDDECGPLLGASCASVAGESRCSVACELGCPEGYACDGARNLCLPVGGSCSCDPGDNFDFACSVDAPMREPGAPVCVGRARCNNGVATSCSVGVEVCDEQDNDCDGLIDEDFRDELDAYSRDPEHCGQCGSSCLEDTGFDQQLVCGGDPFAPRCALACPDTLDGIQPGDRLDGDLDLTTGCECVVQNLADLPGPVGAQGELLDENCDGADGVVRNSVYVAGDGDDSWPGSPTRPLRTLGAAMKLAEESLGTPSPRPHVFVASGSYTETLTLLDGVQVHGGYRRDFRALDPVAYLVEVRAPRGTTAPGGAALVGIDVGRTTTRLEWMSLRGLDATESGGAALGAYIERASRNLVLSGLTLRAGVPAEGTPGNNGVAGAAPSTPANTGALPRAALEDAARQCVVAPANEVQGGLGGRSMCAGVDVSGGNGGSARCPQGVGFQPSGQAGRGPAIGQGGQGGQDSSGPTFSTSCGGTVCCGLADFSVPTNFEGPRAGANGGDGLAGSAGQGCGDGRGRFTFGFWSGGAGVSGRDGQPGSGGGGGGSGGGAIMSFVPGECEFADGLGGGGGGGGAGGCGGRGGSAGQSGAPSVALLVVNADGFTIEDVVFATASGGRGGSGGAGGDGGSGGTGATGGSLPLSARTTPTLAGPFPGARGGSGGSGGAGGGGGGGCGGASVGVWIVGGAPNQAAWRARNRFQLGAGGEGGAGGGGAQAGSRGATGEVANVVVQ